MCQCYNSKLVEWTNYLIDNVYIKLGSKVYRQTVGIPMGTDCAPQLANLFLFHYEYSYMKILMKKNLCVAKKFNDTIRYIDDLLTVNNASLKKRYVTFTLLNLHLKELVNLREICPIWTYQLVYVVVNM